MNEPETPRPAIGLWTGIALALILSSASIVLQISSIAARGDAQLDGRSPEYQQLITMNDQLKAELTRLQSSIAASTTYNQLRRSMKQGPQTAVPSSLLTQTDSPMAALMVLEQSKLRSSFDEYQHVQPSERQKVLDQIFMLNRELKITYDELSALVMSQYPRSDLPEVLSELPSDRLSRIIFKDQRIYDLLETKRNGETEAELRIHLVYVQGAAPLPGESDKKGEVKLKAVREGGNWKVADHAAAQASQDQLLDWLKKRIEGCRFLIQKTNSGDYKTYQEFQKAWESLPKEE